MVRTRVKRLCCKLLLSQLDCSCSAKADSLVWCRDPRIPEVHLFSSILPGVAFLPTMTNYCSRITREILTVEQLLIYYKRTVLSQKKPRDARFFFYTQRLFDCYLLQVPIGQGRIATPALRHEAEHPVIAIHCIKAEWIWNYRSVTTPWRVCFETKCIMTLQDLWFSYQVDSAYKTSYWSSIETLPVSEIWELFVRRKPIFSIGYASTRIPAKISGVFFWKKIPDVWVAERRKSRLISHEIIFEVFQPLSPSTTDKQTDGWQMDLSWHCALRSIVR